MFLDNTACNLASLNLRKFFNVDTHEFDVEKLEYASRLWTVVLEISVLMFLIANDKLPVFLVQVGDKEVLK